MEVAVHGILGTRDRRQVSRDQFVKGFRIPSIIRVEGLTRPDDPLAIHVSYLPLDKRVGKYDSQGQCWDRSPEKSESPLRPYNVVSDDSYEKPDWTNNDGERKGSTNHVPKQQKACTKHTPEV